MLQRAVFRKLPTGSPNRGRVCHLVESAAKRRSPQDLTGTRGEAPTQPGSQAAARLDSRSVGAMRFLFERVKLVTEPSGASALAALLTGEVAGRGKARRGDDLRRQYRPGRFLPDHQPARRLTRTIAVARSRYPETSSGAWERLNKNEDHGWRNGPAKSEHSTASRRRMILLSTIPRFTSHGLHKHRPRRLRHNFRA